MLTLDAPEGANFLNDQIAAAVQARLAEGNHSGIIERDRLTRNLLSSQPTCFNLFGPFVAAPAGLLGWVQTLDAAATEVAKVRFEWAPPRADHFDGGSAFDAVVTYRTATGTRFFGIEVKYAEDLKSSTINVRDTYVGFTASSGLWADDAADRLGAPALRQFWLNTLLAQSMVTRSTGFEAGMVVVVAVDADRAARAATDGVRAELVDPDRWLRWSSYEEVLGAVDADPGWVEAFNARYRDFSPVAHLLSRHDPRRRADAAPPAVVAESAAWHRKVYERHLDLLLAEELSCNLDLSRWFLEVAVGADGLPAGRPEEVVVAISHNDRSGAGEDHAGENDLFVCAVWAGGR